MASGSISDSPLSSKKKRTNGSAKLKQMKLDVRREQWLSRVKKGCNVDSNGRDDYCPSSKHIAKNENQTPYKENKKREGEDIEGTRIRGNDFESTIDNCVVQSTYDHNESINGFTGSSSSSSSSSSGSSNSSSSSTVTCCSRSVSEEENDDECLDDWEAMADALYANDINKHSIVSELPIEPAFHWDTPWVASNGLNQKEFPIEHDKQSSYANSEATMKSNKDFISVVPESHINCQAWKPNDTLRPSCLPNLSKQHNSPLNSKWRGNHKTVSWTWQTIISQPSQCPICYEDLDVTDSSFLPCSCGFRLCLFCHKKIVEADARCPGCRKLYDHHVDGNVGFNMRTKSFYISQSCKLSTTGY